MFYQKVTTVARNHTEQVKHWHTMAFRALPRFSVRDADTLTAFNKKSPWAYAEVDNPFTLKRNNLGNDTAHARELTGSRKEIGKVAFEFIMRIFLH